MSKGTPSQGKKNKRNHVDCKRCGRASFHKRHYRCASCGYPEKRLRRYKWANKAILKRKEGTGRRRHLKKHFQKSPFPLRPKNK